jgi:hypothetical protein
MKKPSIITAYAIVCQDCENEYYATESTNLKEWKCSGCKSKNGKKFYGSWKEATDGKRN